MRLIDADALYHKIHERICKIDNGRTHRKESMPVVDGMRISELEFCIGLIQREPTIEAEPVRKGHWIDRAVLYGWKRGTFRVCSFCNICIPIEKAVPERFWQSCPNCRTVMDEGRKEE